MILSAVLNAPGSWHDSKVARPVFDQLLSNTAHGFYIISDTAFPRGSRDIHGKIKAPLKTGQRLPTNDNSREEVLRFDRQLVSFRQSVEWGMRQIQVNQILYASPVYILITHGQGSFGRLRLPMDITNNDGRAALLEICCRLNNVRATCVGISQIRNVYEPLWRGEDDELWFGFRSMQTLQNLASKS